MKIEMIKVLASGDAAKVTLTRTSRGLIEHLTPQHGKKEVSVTPLPWHQQAEAALSRVHEYEEDGWMQTWESDQSVNEEPETHTVAKINVDRTCQLESLAVPLARWGACIEPRTPWEGQALTLVLPQADAGPCAPLPRVELFAQGTAKVFLRRDAPSLGVLHWLCLKPGISGHIDSNTDLRCIPLTPGMSACVRQANKGLGDVYKAMLAGLPVCPHAHALAI